MHRMEKAVAWEFQVDATGLLCPLPVLRAQKALQAMVPGQTLRLLATDPAAVVDVPHFCAEAGHVMVAVQPCDGPLDGTTAYVIQKGPRAA